MEMRKCENGHYYDASIYSECPYCKMSSAGATQPLTSPVSPGQMPGDGRTIPLDFGSDRTVPVTGGMAGPSYTPSESNISGRTEAFIKEELGMDPVVGWLVCIKGPERGRDFRIHSDYNYIGRSERMDICVRDETISRENHAVIGYDLKEQLFYFAPASGRGIVRLNGKALLTTAELKSHDQLEIGKSTFLFIALCGEQFHWTNEEES